MIYLGLEQFEKLRGVVTETQVRFEGVEYGYLDPTRERSHPSHPDNPNNLSNPNNPDYQERIHDLNQDSIIGFLPSPKKHSTDLNNANSRSQSNSPTQSHSSSPLKHTSNNPGKTLAESKESNQKKTKKIVTPYSLDRLVIVLFNYAFYFIKDIPVLLNNLLNSVNRFSISIILIFIMNPPLISLSFISCALCEVIHVVYVCFSFVSRSVATALEQKEVLADTHMSITCTTMPQIYAISYIFNFM